MSEAEGSAVWPVPREGRTGGWAQLSGLLVTFLLNPLMYVLGALAVIVGRLPLWWAVAAMALGQLVSFSLLVLAARPGTDHGLTGQVAMRAFLGFWGSRVLSSGYRAVVASYWFAAQALAAGLGIQALLGALADVHVPLVPTALGLAALQAGITLLGFDALRYLTRVVLPLGLLFVAVILWLFLRADDPAFALERVSRSPEQELTWTGFATFFTVVAGSTFTFVTNIADFTRFTRSRRHAWIGIVPAAVLTTAVTTFIGGYAAVATGNGNPFVAAPALTANVAVLGLLLLAIVIQSTGVNVINAYSVGLSLLNTAPRLGQLAATAIGAAAAVALAAFPDLVTNAAEWIGHVSNVAFALTGIVLAELLVLTRGRIDVPDLYRPEGRYRYLAGVSVAAVASTAVGVAVYYAVPHSWVKAAWAVGTAALLQLVLSPLQARWLARRDRSDRRRPRRAPVPRQGAPERPG